MAVQNDPPSDGEREAGEKIWPTDYQLTRCSELAEALTSFLEDIAAFTIPHPEGREAYSAEAAVSLDARMRLVHRRFWDSHLALFEKHAQPTPGGAQIFSTGFGGADVALFGTIDRVCTIFNWPTKRAYDAHESGELTRGDTSVRVHDIFSKRTLDQLEALALALRRTKDDIEPLDPRAILNPKLAAEVRRHRESGGRRRPGTRQGDSAAASATSATNAMRAAHTPHHDAEASTEKKADERWRSVSPSGLPLRSWKDIADAMNEPYSNALRHRLKRLNRLTDGPIAWVGTKPEVDRGQLRAWVTDTKGRAARRDELIRARTQTVAELAERGGARQADHRMHTERRPNARGKARRPRPG